MKQQLKRIEAALHHIADRRNQSSTEPFPSRSVPPDETARLAPEPPSDIKGIKNIKLPIQSPAHGGSAKISLPAFSASTSPASPAAIVAPTSDSSPEVLAANLSETKILALPRLKSPTFTSHRNAANPSLTINLLKEMEEIVAGWQDELQHVLRQVQDLYLEGPIVDGWLESYAHQEGEAPAFRHADVDCLMDYVEKMRGSMPPETAPLPQSTDAGEGMQDVNSAGYRLCGLNEDGQLWFRHCPAEQVPSVSLAIARYQRLRILLSRKHYIETRLSQLAETLIVVHGTLNI